jgi:site-specific DNA recombinase
MHPQSTTPLPSQACQLRPGRRAIFAGRVSSEDQKDWGYGLDTQQDDVVKFAQTNDWDLIIDPAYFGDESGRLPLHQRFIYQRILAACKAGKCDVVIYPRVDRIARRAYFGRQLIDELEATGVKVITTDLHVDTATPEGRMLQDFLLVQAEYGASSSIRNTGKGREKRLDTKKPWFTGKFYGYRYTRPSHADGVEGGVVKHEEDAQTINWMFQRRAEGASYERIAQELTAQGKPSPAGHKAWSQATVRNIIHNESYLGTGKWGKRKNVRSENGKRSSRKRHDDEKLWEMNFPRVVTDDLWRDAHAADTCQPVCRPAKNVYLLRERMLRCAEHGRTMTGTGSGKNDARYRCQRALGGDCVDRQIHSIPARALEDAVWEELLGYLAEPERGRRGVHELIAQREQAAAAEEAQIALLREREVQAQSKIDAALEIALTNELARKMLDAKVAAITEELEQTQREISQAEARLALARADIPPAEEVAEQCRRLSKGAQHLDDAGKREMFETVQLRVWVRGDEWWADGILPGLHLQGKVSARKRVQVESARGCVSDIHPLGFRLEGRIIRRGRGRKAPESLSVDGGVGQASNISVAPRAV